LASSAQSKRKEEGRREQAGVGPTGPPG
jgi:hypothetical protein